ncbi:unnamed protein product [Euphydryas editha]|uniref:FLYWCH-type domain-containing protein n=1 Tax=Euphydryas editha TaxID=104508 RepID=A0AAU9TJX2_EUPED|nr:unnamed protein product [Euphydryas editha]
MTVVKSRYTGKEIVILDDYTYYCKRMCKNRNWSHWYCSTNNSKGCNAKLKLNDDFDIIEIADQHNHPPAKYSIHDGLYIFTWFLFLVDDFCYELIITHFRQTAERLKVLLLDSRQGDFSPDDEDDEYVPSSGVSTKSELQEQRKRPPCQQSNRMSMEQDNSASKPLSANNESVRPRSAVDLGQFDDSDFSLKILPRRRSPPLLFTNRREDSLDYEKSTSDSDCDSVIVPARCHESPESVNKAPCSPPDVQEEDRVNIDGEFGQQATQTGLQSNNFHYLERILPTQKKQKPTKRCRVCTKEKKRKETSYYCPVCPENPALCVENCFKLYHEEKLNMTSS